MTVDTEKVTSKSKRKSLVFAITKILPVQTPTCQFGISVNQRDARK